jgi:Calx-beta domain
MSRLHHPLHTESDRLPKDALTTEGEETIDLTGENTVDVPLSAADARSAADSPVARGLPRAYSANPGNCTSDSQETDESPPDLLPKQRAWGFLAFVVCALTGISLAMERHARPSYTDASAASVPLPFADAPGHGALTSQPIDEVAVPASTSRATATGVVQEEGRARTSETKTTIAEANTTLGAIAFDPASVVTSERAIAAIFIVKRTQPARGRVSVQWAVHSGSADAAIDFADASGTVRFADGQRQLAIYVPLRNDLLKEDSETFEVCLRSPRRARIGAAPCAEATIRDDDTEST